MAATADNGEKMILLISSDGERFELSESAASQSKTLSHIIEDDCTDNGVPLPNVTTVVLAKVVEYFKKHAAVTPKPATEAVAAGNAKREEELKSFDAEFIGVDRTMLFELILAANFLNAQDLLDLTCQHAADLIKDMSVEEVREVFNITNDFTPEEEAEVPDNGEKMILLISSDGERFELSESAASQSKTLSHIIEDDCTDNGVPLPNVTAVVLVEVVEYFKKHAAVTPKPATEAVAADNAKRLEELKSFDAKFVGVDRTMLFELILAANFLNAQDLLDLTCQHAADLIKDMSVEEVREVFNITNDFTPEEEAEVRKENAWAFDN
uniref:SKP1-like protein n=1 Tax=Oryza meridionalis TaxID=40149 RepID=A0A0E0EL08_9ORYZ